MSRPDGGNAHTEPDEKLKGVQFSEAVSLRDYYAGQALTGLLAASGVSDVGVRHLYAVTAYQLADAMIEEREK